MSQPDATAQPPKRYTSEVRDEQARRTRRAIVTAARDLFLARGYAATTIDGIAEAAHVQPAYRVQLGGRQGGPAQAGL